MDYVDFFKWKMTETESAIYAIILAHDKYANRAVKRYVLLAKLRRQYDIKISDREMRDTISNMIRRGFPIGSCSNIDGYFLLRLEDIEICNRQDLSRIKKIRERIEGRSKAIRLLQGQQILGDIYG